MFSFCYLEDIENSMDQCNLFTVCSIGLHYLCNYYQCVNVISEVNNYVIVTLISIFIQKIHMKITGNYAKTLQIINAISIFSLTSKGKFHYYGERVWYP